MKAIATLFVFFVLLTIPLHSQWVECESPTGGDVHSITHFGNSLLAGLTGGVYRSSDNGDSWSLVGLQGRDIPCVFVNGTTIFAATNSNNGLLVEELYRSMDGGTTWNKISTAPTMTVLSFGAIGSTLFIGTKNAGIYRSIDNGDTWTQVKTGTFNVTSIAATTNTLFAATDLGIIATTNLGETWTKITSVNQYSYASITTIADTIFALPQDVGSICKSTDGGKSWKEVNFGISSSQTSYSTVALVGTSLFVGGSDGMYRSKDHGNTWSVVNTGIESEEIQSIAVIGAQIVVGTKKMGCYRSRDNGEHWTLSNSGMPKHELVNILSEGTALYVSSRKGVVFASNDNGISWTRLSLKHNVYNGYLDAMCVNDSSLFIAGTGGVYRSMDHGVHWKSLTLANYVPYPKLACIGSTIFLGGNGVPFQYSTDNGENWNVWKTSGFLQNELVISSLLVHDSVLYIGAESINQLHSINGTWKEMYHDRGFSVACRALAVVDTFLFVGNSYGVLRSGTSPSSSWTLMNSGIDTSIQNMSYANCMAVSGTTLYLATYQGTYFTTDNAEHWNKITWNDKHLPFIDGMTIHKNTVYAVGRNGIWKCDPSTLNTDNSLPETGHVASLVCYPNPTTNSLTIDRTSLPFTSGAVNYTILSVTGEKVYEGEIAEPRLSLPVDTFPTGVYSLVARQGMVRTSVVFTVVR